MTLSKYIGKIDQFIHNMDDHLDPNYPVFTDGKDFYWFMVEYTDNAEMVIHDTCGRVMPIPVEMCGELSNLLYIAARASEARQTLEKNFHEPTTSTF